MKIASIMSRPVVWIAPEASVKEAAEKMARFNIGDLPAYADEQVVGMITDRDIVVRVLAKGKDPRKTKVSEIMTKDVQWSFDDEDLADIVRRMEEKCIHRMVIIDHDKKLCGIVSLGDIAVRGDEKLAAEALRQISELRRSRYGQIGGS